MCIIGEANCHGRQEPIRTWWEKGCMTWFLGVQTKSAFYFITLMNNNWRLQIIYLLYTNKVTISIINIIILFLNDVTSYIKKMQPL